jgi:hypothetical protein
LEAGIHSKPRDVEHSSAQTVSPYGLTVQGANIGKPSEMDPEMQKLPIAKPRLPRAAQKDSGRSERHHELMQLGHETSLQPSMGPKTPGFGGYTPMQQTPKNLGLYWTLGHIRKLCPTLRQPFSWNILRKIVMLCTSHYVTEHWHQSKRTKFTEVFAEY